MDQPTARIISSNVIMMLQVVSLAKDTEDEDVAQHVCSVYPEAMKVTEADLAKEINNGPTPRYHAIVYLRKLLSDQAGFIKACQTCKVSALSILGGLIAQLSTVAVEANFRSLSDEAQATVFERLDNQIKSDFAHVEPDSQSMIIDLALLAFCNKAAKAKAAAEKAITDGNPPGIVDNTVTMLASGYAGQISGSRNHGVPPGEVLATLRKNVAEHTLPRFRTIEEDKLPPMPDFQAQFRPIDTPTLH